MPSARADQITIVLEMWNSFPGPSRPTFAVVGCCKSLGWWNPKRALVAEPIDDDQREWRVIFTVPLWFTKVEFKWLIIDPVTMEVIQWEETPLRVLPLTQRKEKVRCWFDSKGTATKILPVNLNDSAEIRVGQFQKCVDEIKVYMDHGLDVEIRYDYTAPDDIIDKDSGIDLHVYDTGEKSTHGDNVDAAAPSTPHVCTQISRVGTSLVAEVTSPGGAADHGNRQEVVDHGNMWRNALRWKSLMSAGLLIGGAFAAWRLAKS